jgi:phytoene synthase
VAVGAYSSSWEYRLLDLAYDARRSPVGSIRSVRLDTHGLESAYAHCEGVTRANSRSFYLASSLVPAAKSRALRALYSFCRTTDDIVDRPGEAAEVALATWRRRAMSADPAPDDPVALAWTDTRLRYGIPWRFAEQLIDGVGRDLHQKRYGTFDELTAYAYGVASTVGLMSMHILGFSGEEAVPYAVKLGVALQITNILRDVGEDWRAGRVYLPADEMEGFGLSEEDLAAECVHDRWRDFMRFQIDRNRRLYAEAWPGIGMLSRDGRLAVAAAAEFYRAILGDIEAHDYDVFQRRAHVSGWGKLRRLPRLWWHCRREP